MRMVSRVVWALVALWSAYVTVNWFIFYVLQVAMRNNPDVSAIQIAQVAVEGMASVVLPACLALALDRVLGRE